MSTKRKSMTLRNAQRGMSIFVVAMSMVALLGMAALALDLATLYLARNEAQRAADAAALAGAKAIADSGYLSGAADQSTAQNLATPEAIALGQQNSVGGQSASVSVSGFDFTNPQDPRITVVVQRTQANGNAMPTFFGKILGFLSADISATATAEAFTPSGTGGASGTTGTICLKPWLLPNCDPSHPATAQNPSGCSGTGTLPGGFINTSGAIANPGLSSSGGLIGENLFLTPSSTSNSPNNTPGPTVGLGPSVPLPFYALQEGSTVTACPASDGSDSSLQKNTECCNTAQYFCGTLQTVQSVSPTDLATYTEQGVGNLINSVNGGQDSLNTSSSPFQVTAGANNPLQGQVVTTSNSIVTVPLYSGGISSSGKAVVIGFLQLFVNSVSSNGTVSAVVLGATGCATTGGNIGNGSSPPLLGATGSTYPVRLVNQ